MWRFRTGNILKTEFRTQDSGDRILTNLTDSNFCILAPEF